MFYIGAWFSENYDKAVFSIIKQNLQNIKKHYHLIDFKYFESKTDYYDIENELISLFNNRCYISNRRVFSQDRRPAKNIKACPNIIMNFWNRDTSRIDRLREKNIPIEGISIRNPEQNPQKWEKQEHSTICLGHNYYVDKTDFFKALQKAAAQKRVTIEDKLQNRADIYDLIYNMDKDNMDKAKINKFSDAVLAVALPVWFKETIRIIRRY